MGEGRVGEQEGGGGRASEGRERVGEEIESE